MTQQLANGFKAAGIETKVELGRQVTEEMHVYSQARLALHETADLARESYTATQLAGRIGEEVRTRGVEYQRAPYRLPRIQKLHDPSREDSRKIRVRFRLFSGDEKMHLPRLPFAAFNDIFAQFQGREVLNSHRHGQQNRDLKGVHHPNGSMVRGRSVCRSLQGPLG